MRKVITAVSVAMKLSHRSEYSKYEPEIAQPTTAVNATTKPIGLPAALATLSANLEKREE